MINALLLVGLHAFVSTSVSHSEGLDHVTHTRFHAQHRRIWRGLQIHYISRAAGIKLSWGGRHGQIEQAIQFPILVDENKEPYGWWLTHYPAQQLRPHAFLWFHGSSTSLVFIATYLTGAYGVQAPIIYTLHGNSWKRLPIDPIRMSFTNRGTFYILGNRVYVCDYAVEDGYAHMAPQHYCLKTFIIHGDHVCKLHTRMTHRRYPISEADPPPIDYPAKIDPLRELGLKWRYWGNGKEQVMVLDAPN